MRPAHFFNRNRCPTCQTSVDPWEHPAGFDQVNLWVCKSCGQRLVRTSEGASYGRAALMAVSGATGIILLEAWWMDLLAVAGFGALALVRFPRWQVYKSARRRAAVPQDPPAIDPVPCETETPVSQLEHAEA